MVRYQGESSSLMTVLGVTVVGAGVLVIGSTLGAGIGAVCGQILDWVPYLNHAIPEGVAYLGNAFGDTDNTREVIGTLEGNLDKVGAGMGFVGGFLKSSVSYKK